MKGVTVEMGFCWWQVRQIVGNTGEEAEFFNGLTDLVVGVGYEGNDLVELGILIRRKVDVKIIGIPLAADVSDLGGGAFDLSVYKFEKKKELGGCKAHFDQFGRYGSGIAGLQVVEEMSEGDGTQTVIKREGCLGFGGCKVVELGG